MSGQIRNADGSVDPTWIGGAVPLTVAEARELLESMEKSGWGWLPLWIQHPEADMQWGPVYDIVAPAITDRMQKIALIDPIDRTPEEPVVPEPVTCLVQAGLESTVEEIMLAEDRAYQGPPSTSVEDMVAFLQTAEIDPLGPWVADTGNAQLDATIDRELEPMNQQIKNQQIKNQQINTDMSESLAKTAAPINYPVEVDQVFLRANVSDTGVVFTEPGKDPHLQPEGQPWRFDDAVTNSFTEMIEASIPGYHDMRKLSFKLGRRFLPDNGGVVIDIGSSRGDSLAPFVEAYPDQNYYAVEISEPMRQVLKERFLFPGNAPHNVTICEHDLRYNLSVFEVKSDLILDSLSLMFIPLERRQRLVQAVYDSLKPGGAFISIQKMLGADSYTHDLLDAEYLEMKREHGYSHEQILRKKLSLEGVLVPVTLDWNLDMMRRAGFRRMDVFWKSLQFSGIICVKE